MKKTNMKPGTVEVMIPRSSADKDPNYFVAVNGVNYILPRGKKSVVPDYVAEEINRSFAAEQKMFEAQAALQELASK